MPREKTVRKKTSLEACLRTARRTDELKCH